MFDCVQNASLVSDILSNPLQAKLIVTLEQNSDIKLPPKNKNEIKNLTTALYKVKFLFLVNIIFNAAFQ